MLDQLAGEVADVLLGLAALVGVALGALVGCEDEIFGLDLDLFYGCDVAVEFADVGADYGATFSELLREVC